MAEGGRNVSDPAFWDEHYRRGDTGWDLGQAAPSLVAWLAGPEAPPPGRRVAVLGCGYGHEVLLFARAGHVVTGFDFSATALAVARERTEAARVVARFEQADIFTLPARYKGGVDLVVEHTCFCAIDPTRRAEYVEVVYDVLAPGGQLVGLFYAHGQPGGPPFTTSQEEVDRLFSPHFAIRRLEVALDSTPRRANQEILAVLVKGYSFAQAAS